MLFCVYLDGLLHLFQKSNLGCFIDDVFVGAMAYANDIALLAPTAQAMRYMLQVCDQYAKEYSMVFNASKSKCLVISRRKHSLVTNVKPTFYIGGKEIEYVDSWPHLDNLVHTSCNDQHDIVSKKNSLCGQIN